VAYPGEKVCLRSRKADNQPDRPVESNPTAAGKAKSRRVEFVIQEIMPTD